MPPAAKQDTPAAVPAVPADVTMAVGEHNPFVNALLTHAQILADEHADVVKRQGGNRDTLRSLKVQKLMSPEQETAVDEFYPVRTRKPKPTPPATASGAVNAPTTAPAAAAA